MSDHTRTRSMQNPAIASVKRRHTGPFLPCPKAKRMALMDQKDSKHDNQNSKTTLEDCVDFAVESSKADNVVSTEESVQVIESGSENGDSPQELVEDNEDVIEQIVVDADPNENDVDEEEIVMMEINNHRNDVVLINDDILMIDEPRMVTPPPTPPPPPPPQPITIPSTRSSPQAQENCACPHQIVVGPTKLDLHQLSPQVVLKKSKKVERFLQRQQEAENIIKFRTYKVHGYELRHFQIVLTDYYQEQSIQNSKNIDTSPDNRYSTSSASKAQQDGFSTPTKEIINSVKSTEGNVNTPEFMARYEDCVAEKLLTLRKRLDTPDKPNSPIPNRLNIEGQQATNSSSIVTPLNIDIDTDKQPIHPRTRLRLSPVKKSPTSSSLKYVLRKSVVENYVEVSDSDSDSQCSVMTVSDIEYTSSGKKVIRVKEEYVELSDDTELEELEKSMKIEKEVEDVESDDEARDGDNEGEDDSSSMTSHDDDGSSSTSPDEENNYINTSSVKTENVKTEIKEEVVDSEPSSQVESSLFVGDEESMDNLLDAYHKVKRKQSLNRSFPTVGKSPVKPSLIPLVKKSPVRKYKSFLGSNLSARYQQDTDTDTDTSIIRKPQQMKIKPLTIKLVNLSKETIENVIHLCSSTADWRDDELLEKAGLSSYDITRLGIVTATRQSTNYGLRQFVKKKKIFEVFLPPEKPKPLSKKQEPKIKINRKELKKLKRKQLMKEKQEAKQKEKESIRRALLKINNRFINQNKFWAFIDGGSSENHPILL